MGRVAVDFGVGQGAKRSAEIQCDLGQASNEGQRQNQRNRRWREAEGRLASSLGRYSPLRGCASLAPCHPPSASTRGLSQYFNRLLGSSKDHSHPAKKYIRPVFMFGHLSGNRIPDVLIAWNEPDRRCDGEIVENFHSHFVVN